MSCEKLVILNKPLKFNLNKIKLNYSPFYMWEAPSTTYGGISIDPISGLSELLQLVVRQTRLAVSMVLTTCLGPLAGEAALLWGCQGSRTVFRTGGTLNVFPLMR